MNDSSLCALSVQSSWSTILCGSPELRTPEKECEAARTPRLSSPPLAQWPRSAICSTEGQPQAWCNAVTDAALAFRTQQVRELELSPSPSYLEQHAAVQAPGQPLTAHMLATVVSWMVEVTDEFQLQHETLHRAVSLLHRFLSNTQAVAHGVLQLLAVTCILVASKDLEVSPPSVEQLTCVAANSFTPQDVRRMECILLDCVDFRVAAPTAFTCQHLLTLSLGGLPLAVQHTASLLVELSLLSYHLLVFRPSEVAASAIALAAMQHGCAATGVRAAHLAGMADERHQTCMAVLLRLQHAAASAGDEGDGTDLLLPVRCRYDRAALTTGPTATGLQRAAHDTNQSEAA